MNTNNQALTDKEIAIIAYYLDEADYCICAVSNSPITDKFFDDNKHLVQTIIRVDAHTQTYISEDGRAYKYAKPITFDIDTMSVTFYN